MRYIIGLIIGVVLMTTWPQQTRLIFASALEYIELGTDKARNQMDNKKKSGLGSNTELMIGMILLSGASDASFLSSIFDMLNHDNYMPQAYSGIDTVKKHTSYPPKQHTHLYMEHLINHPNKRKYVAKGVSKSKKTSPYNENE